MFPQKVMARAVADAAELYIYDAIGPGLFGGISADQVRQELDKVKGAKTLDVYVNSPGGDVFDGIAINSLIQRFDAATTVHVDGLAASAASIVALAGDRIVTAEAASWMVHEPWGYVQGPATDMRQQADLLDKIREQLVGMYTSKTGQTAEQIRSWMAEETWFTAAEAMAAGLTDEVLADGKAAPQDTLIHPLLARYQHTPKAAQQQYDQARQKIAAIKARTIAHLASQRVQDGQPSSAPHIKAGVGQ